MSIYIDIAGDNNAFVVWCWSVSWPHIVTAVKHEIFPQMGTAMDAVVERLKEEEMFNLMDLEKTAVDKVVEKLKEKRKVTSSQLAYIEAMVLRAHAFMDS